jgi:toxin CcdB
MRQFDVCRLKERGDQLIVVLQHDITDELDTRIVAPLSDRPYRRIVDRARLPVDLDGNHYVIQIDRLSAIERRAIGAVIGSLATNEQRIKSALDLLFFGV